MSSTVSIQFPASPKNPPRQFKARCPSFVRQPYARIRTPARRGRLGAKPQMGGDGQHNKLGVRLGGEYLGGSASGGWGPADPAEQDPGFWYTPADDNISPILPIRSLPNYH
jgi:hypothetical protein